MANLICLIQIVKDFYRHISFSRTFQGIYYLQRLFMANFICLIQFVKDFSMQIHFQGHFKAFIFIYKDIFIANFICLIQFVKDFSRLIDFQGHFIKTYHVKYSNICRDKLPCKIYFQRFFKT